MTDAHEPFERLLERARGGDRKAWGRLFDRLAKDDEEGRALHAMARRALPSNDRARDIVDSLDLLQSALREGWIDASQFRGESEREFYAWMRTIIQRRLSRATRRKRPDIGLATHCAEEGAAGGDRRETKSPLESLIASEMKSRLTDAIRALPAEQRSVLLLRLKGKKSPEIATELGLTPETVRKRESRAAARLREILASEAD